MAKTLTIRIDDELHKKFKMYALEKDTDMSTLVIEYIKTLVEKSENEE